MSRWISGCFPLVLAFTLVGCKGDEKQAVVTNMIAVLKDARSQFESLTNELTQAVDKAKEVDQEDGQKVKKLAPENVTAIKDILKKQFKDDIVKRCQNLQAKAQMFKKSDEKERKELAAANKNNLDNAIRELYEEHEKLKKAIDNAEKVDKASTKQITDELDSALGELNLIAQRK